MENYRKSMLLVILQWAVPIILFLSAFFLSMLITYIIALQCLNLVFSICYLLYLTME